MSDKLEWRNQHLVLFAESEVAQCAHRRGYELSGECAALCERYPVSEDYVRALEQQGKCKEACTFMCYNLHQRAALWWGYLCVVDLQEELRQNPARIRELEDIGTPRELPVPDWAQPLPPTPPDPELMARFEQAQAKMLSLKDQVLSAVSPEARENFEAALNIVNAEFARVHGMNPFELLQKMADNYKGSEIELDLENSPIFKARDELKARLEQIRKDTVGAVRQALGPKDVQAEQKHRSNAMDLVFSFIAAPGEQLAAECLDLGNKIPDKPQGLLALCAFWSYGNIAPDSGMVVKTPAGLFAKGLSNLLLMCALQEGGLRNFRQRFESYMKLGFKVATGELNWAEWVKKNQMPHTGNVQRKQAEPAPRAEGIQRFRI